MKRQHIINVLKRLHCTDEDIQRLVGDYKGPESLQFIICNYIPSSEELLYNMAVFFKPGAIARWETAIYFKNTLGRVEDDLLSFESIRQAKKYAETYMRGPVEHPNSTAYLDYNFIIKKQEFMDFCNNKINTEAVSVYCFWHDNHVELFNDNEYSLYRYLKFRNLKQ